MTTTTVPIYGGPMHGQTIDAFDEGSEWIGYDMGDHMAFYLVERVKGRPVHYVYVSRK